MSRFSKSSKQATQPMERVVRAVPVSDVEATAIVSIEAADGDTPDNAPDADEDTTPAAEDAAPDEQPDEPTTKRRRRRRKKEDQHG